MVLQDKCRIGTNDRKYRDISVFCSDGFTVTTNTFLVSSLSRWLYTLIMDQSKQEDVVIIIPDIQSQNIVDLLQTVENSIEKNTLRNIVKERPDVILPWIQVFSPEDQENELDEENDSNKKEVSDIIIKNNISLEKVKTNYETEQSDKNICIQKVEKDIHLSELEEEYISLSKVLPSANDNFNEPEKSSKIFSLDFHKNRNEKINNSISTQQIENKSKETNDSLDISPVLMNSTKISNPTSSKIKKKKNINSFQKKQFSGLKLAPKHNKMIREEFRNSFEKSNVSQDFGQEFECKDEIIKTKYKNHLSKHKKMALRVEKFVCECEEKWENNAQKLRHMKLQHYGHVKCNMCLKTFKKSALLNEHMKKKHDNKGVNLCPSCGKSSSSYHSLNIHMKLMHDNTIVKCDKCGKEVKGKYKMKDHIDHVHNRKPCPICGKTFFRHRLNVHMQAVHTEDKDKTYICGICRKGFPTKVDIKKHEMNVHIKARPYNCRYGCIFAYNDSSNRNSHERKKHGNTYKENNILE